MGAGYAISAKGNKRGEILIYEDVGEGWFGGVSAKQFSEDLKALGEITDLDIRINSYGGDVFDGLAIYNQLVAHKARKVVHVDGVAASIASIIAMSGDDIRIAENAWMMIHDAWGMAIGNAADLRRQADLLESVTDKLAGVYVARTNIGLDAVRVLMAEETWLSAGDAIDKGFATTIVENQRMAAHAAAPDHIKFRHLPAELGGSKGTRAAAPVRLSAADQALRERLNAAADRMRRTHLIDRFKSRGAGSPGPAA